MKREDAPEAICVWDTETNGVDITQNRILTAYAMVRNIEGKTLAERSWILNPEVDIAPEASRVNGLTREHLAEHGRRDWENATLEIRDFLYKAAGRGIPLVGYNQAFDLGTLSWDLVRIEGMTLDLDPRRDQFFDPFVYDVGMVKKRYGNRKLMTVAGKHYGIPIDESRLHEAQYDVEVTNHLAWKMLKQSPYTVAELQGKQVEWRRAYAENLTEHFASVGKTEEDGSPIVVDPSFPWNREKERA